MAMLHMIESGLAALVAAHYARHVPAALASVWSGFLAQIGTIPNSPYLLIMRLKAWLHLAVLAGVEASPAAFYLTHVVGAAFA